MAIAFASSGVLAALKTDIASAWSVAADHIYTQAPQVPGDADLLPAAFIEVDVQPTEPMALRDVRTVHVYRLTYMGETSAVTDAADAIFLEKKSKVNALVALLTADDTAMKYGGAYWLMDGLAWEVDTADLDTTEDIFATTLVFPVMEVNAI